MAEIQVLDTKLVATVQDQQIIITTEKDDPVVLEVAEQGPPGPMGKQGPTGPEGPRGGGTVIIQQAVPSALWTIYHNMGKYPAVTVVDSGMTTVEGEVTYINTNILQISFSAAFSGTAYLN